MKRYIYILCVSLVFFFSPVWAQSTDAPAGVQAPPAQPPAPPAEPPKPATDTPKERLVSLDFDNVDIPVLVKFIGELTMKNFVIDEQVRGKITLFSPVKIPVSSAYDVFLAVLDMKGYKVVPAGPVYQILPAAAAPPPRSIHSYMAQNADVDEISKVLLGIVSRVEPPRPGASIKGGESPGNITGRVDITTDKTTNSLIITASDEDYTIVEKMIKDLDVPRQQVYVEALVLEMSADMFREIGTDLGALFGLIRGDAFTIGGFNKAPPDLSASIVSSSGGAGTTASVSGFPSFLTSDVRPINIRAFLHALQSEPRVNVLSTPQLLASDRQKAEIVVGQLVPFPGGQSQTTGGNVQTTIERKDVGITLRLTPTIMASKKVKLDIFQEISSVSETATRAGDQNLGPTTNKRSATTNVTVKDGQTVVIGGLLKDNVITTNTGIPFLSRIPILGWFFGTNTKRIEKTNLLIFITPHIVPEDEKMNGLDAIREKKMQQTKDFMEQNDIDSDTNQTKTIEKITPPSSTP